ncbi:MAG: HEAT repeat domain-containing protein [Planctomycetota bacterium]|jgi:HEAT repeat protein
MYRDVLPDSKLLADITKDIVCVLAHNPDTHKTWTSALRTYLYQYFYHPAYVFADREGNQLFEDFTLEYMHRMVSEDILAGKLKELLDITGGKIVPREKWKSVRDEIAGAQAQYGKSGAADAVKMLDKIISENGIPVLTKKAEEMKREIFENAFYKEEIVRLDLERSRRTLAEVARTYRGRSEGKKALEELEKLGVKDPDSLKLSEDELAAIEVYRGAIDDALAADYISAVLALETFLKKADAEKYKTHAELLKMLKPRTENPLEIGPMRVCRKSAYGYGNRYWEVGCTLTSRYTYAGGLTVVFNALTDRGNVFRGFEIFDGIVGEKRHRISAFLPFDKVAIYSDENGRPAREKVIDARFDVWLGGKVVVSRTISGDGKNTWWERAENGRLIFILEQGQWESWTLKSKRQRGLIPENRPEPEKEPADIETKIMDAILSLGETMDPTELGIYRKKLRETGEPAIEPLIKALDPSESSRTTACISALASLRARKALPEIIKLLDSDDLFLVRTVLIRLPAFGDAGAVPAEKILKHLDSGEWWIRQAAAYALSHIRDAATLPALAKKLEAEDNARAREHIIRAITRISSVDFGFKPGRPAPEQTEALAKLKEWMKSHDGGSWEAWALEAIRAADYDVPESVDINTLSEDAMKALAKAVVDEKEHISFAAIKLLTASGKPAAVDAFLDVLRKSKSRALRAAATDGIFEVADRSVIKKLIEAAKEYADLAGDIVPILEDLTGMSFDVAEDENEMKPWEGWFAKNGGRLYRPPGSYRFRIKEK